jgi:hypothetical protein
MHLRSVHTEIRIYPFTHREVSPPQGRGSGKFAALKFCVEFGRNPTAGAGVETFWGGGCLRGEVWLIRSES